MITIFGAIDGVGVVATLPHPIGWTIRVKRPQAARLALGGNTIRQTFRKSIAMGEGSFSVQATAAQAAALAAIDMGADLAYVSDGRACYEVVLDATISDTALGSRKLCEVAFTVSRQVA